VRNLKLGNTLSHDQLPTERFDYCLANPPFGVKWEMVQKAVNDEHRTLGYAGRFGPGLPRVGDGSLLFLMHLLSKRKPVEQGGTRIGIVLSGSPLFNGGAGSGESEIRRWILENDWLEAIVALPTDLFYNTGIGTYVWLLTNHKAPERKGNVQLIDAGAMSSPMRKSLGSKRKLIAQEQIDDIARWHDAFDDGETSKLFDTADFGYSLDKTDRIDLAFFINGIAVATVELKTDFTQRVEAAMAQYRQDRPPKSVTTGRAEPLLAFQRGAVVHFAMSDSDIRMATKLDGPATVFLPFNRGNDGAAGNPPGADGGYPVAYLWQQVLQRDNWLRIFHRFVLTERRPVQDAQGQTQFKETQIFPRFHQLEGVTAIVDKVRAEGTGQPYLIQHSAGSGKTNTISWTAHELIRIRRPDGEPYFHSVIVVTDRTVLDKQLQDAIAQIEHQTGVVRARYRFFVLSSAMRKSIWCTSPPIDPAPRIDR
jgi:hypothetical protein